MTNAKNIIGRIIESGIEATKDSVKQVVKTVNPTDLVDNAIGSGKRGEFTDYLRNLSDGSLSRQDLAKKEAERAAQDKAELAKIRSVFNPPEHMKIPGKQTQPRPYEQTVQDLERQNAMEVEAQQKQAATFIPAAGKPKGKLGQPLRRPAQTNMGIETKVDKKMG